MVDAVLSRLETILHIWEGAPGLSTGITKKCVMPRSKQQKKPAKKITEIFAVIIIVLDFLTHLFEFLEKIFFHLK